MASQFLPTAAGTSTSGHSVVQPSSSSHSRRSRVPANLQFLSPLPPASTTGSIAPSEPAIAGEQMSEPFLSSITTEPRHTETLVARAIRKQRGPEFTEVIIELPINDAAFVETTILYPSTQHEPANPLARSTNRIVVLLHPWSRAGGNANDPVLLSFLSLFLRRDYHVILYNSRGVGNSGGSTSWTGLNEAQDLQTIVDLALREIDAVNEIVLLGYSYGSLPASLHPSRPPRLFTPSALAKNPHIRPDLKIRHVLLSYPVGVLWLLTLFHTSTYLRRLKELVSSPGADVLILYGEKDQFSRVDKYTAWLEDLRSAWREGVLQVGARRREAALVIEETRRRKAASAEQRQLEREKRRQERQERERAGSTFTASSSTPTTNSPATSAAPSPLPSPSLNAGPPMTPSRGGVPSLFPPTYSPSAPHSTLAPPLTSPSHSGSTAVQQQPTPRSSSPVLSRLTSASDRRSSIHSTSNISVPMGAQLSGSGSGSGIGSSTSASASASASPTSAGAPVGTLNTHVEAPTDGSAPTEAAAPNNNNNKSHADNIIVTAAAPTATSTTQGSLPSSSQDVKGKNIESKAPSSFFGAFARSRSGRSRPLSTPVPLRSSSSSAIPAPSSSTSTASSATVVGVRPSLPTPSLPSFTSTTPSSSSSSSSPTHTRSFSHPRAFHFHHPPASLTSTVPSHSPSNSISSHSRAKAANQKDSASGSNTSTLRVRSGQSTVNASTAGLGNGNGTGLAQAGGREFTITEIAALPAPRLTFHALPNGDHFWRSGSTAREMRGIVEKWLDERVEDVGEGEEVEAILAEVMNVGGRESSDASIESGIEGTKERSTAAPSTQNNGITC